MVNLLITILVLGGCVFAYVAIGDLFDHFFRSRTAEQVHRRWRPLSHTDRPAVDPRDMSGGYVDDTYGSGTWSDPNYPGAVRDGGYDPNLGGTANVKKRRSASD